MTVKQFVAIKAFIEYRGKILLLRESAAYSDGANAGKFDVPGGRITPGEGFEDAFLREIKEETGLEIQVGEPFFVGEWRPVVKGEEWQVVGTFFACRTKTDEVHLSKDHDRYLWVTPGEHAKLPLLPAIKEAFDAYMKRK